MSIRIRQVDGDDWCDEIQDLHQRTFGKDAPMVTPDGEGYWWLAFDGDKPVAFLGMIQSKVYADYGYFSRVGVLSAYRGQGLQRRLMRVMERQARKIVAWKGVVSDTTRTPESANNFVACGWKTFLPAKGWGFSDTIYWYKDFR